MDAHVVIGANYGDEGKGLMTDYLVRKHDARLVVRFNGGAQAGHTVVDGDVRHVFSHFGSGTLAGAATFLSKFFVCNPALFVTEARKLAKATKRAPSVVIDPRSLITTPFDMLINQEVEHFRCSARHGSCGVGFNETIERSNHGFAIRAADLQSPKSIRLQVENILHRYVRDRCLSLGLPKTAVFRCLNERMIDPFVADCEWMARHCELSEPGTLGRSRIVFEGAQGLLLDQNNEAFPHVTRSNTGVKNVLELAPEFGIDRLRLVYVSRTYLTRHGAGPLPNEWRADRVPETITDETNVPHPFQGSLRFAPLDEKALCERTFRDASTCLQSGTPDASVEWALTCLDQVDPPSMHCSYEVAGPTASDVTETNQRARRSA